MNRKLIFRKTKFHLISFRNLASKKGNRKSISIQIKSGIDNFDMAYEITVGSTALFTELHTHGFIDISRVTTT